MGLNGLCYYRFIRRCSSSGGGGLRKGRREKIVR